MTVLWLAEQDGGGVIAASASALEFARTLAGTSGAGVTAVVFGSESSAVALAGCGVTEIRRVEAALLAGYGPAAWASALRQLAEADGASAVVAAATDRGSEVMAHLGAMTGFPVAANCVSGRELTPGRWQLVRQRWAGSVLEDAVLEAPMALLTVAADAAQSDTSADAAQSDTSADAAQSGAAADAELPAAQSAGGAPPGIMSAGADPVVSVFTPELEPAELRVQAVETAERGTGDSLATARVVVGGGRGVGGPEGFAALEELAGLLGGVVGVSRVVTSAGWRPHRQQVGQTGTKISPELYLACGISGAIQHMAGCLSARHIIAVNTDPDAPIIARADYAVIADLHELIPALVVAIRGRADSAPQ